MKKKLFAVLILMAFCQLKSFCQVTATVTDGGTVVTKLGMGISVNDGSSLNRQFYTLNDTTCPIQLVNAGIYTTYSSSSYSFRPVGSITPKEPIVAYEIHYLLYNVFGEHIKTLSDTEISDFSVSKEPSKYSSWYASSNQVSEYFTCVSYIANVRTKSGKIWRYDFNSIQSELMKVKLKYDEDYTPLQDEKK